MRFPRSLRTLAPVLIGLAVTGASSARAPAPGSAPARGDAPPGRQVTQPPRLLVFMVVDQLPAYLLERYDDLFTGGLRRLLDRGRVFTQTTHDHAVTETTPGHATLSTGTFPSHSGMVSNQWWEQEGTGGQWTAVLNVVDTDTRIVGAPTVAGASPGKLLRSGLAEWLTTALPDARIVSVSAKDRAAVLLAARSPAQVAWFEPELGRFATSTFYGDRDPDWLATFNHDELPALAGDSVWRSTVPRELAARSRPDTAAYEGDGVLTSFPHRYLDAVGRVADLEFWPWWAGTPMLDEATLALAQRAVTARQLGQDEVPDMLAVSLSQTDRVGHAYGPYSREQLDNLLRLDRELGAFFDWLDTEVGQDRWLVSFSSDHGVSPDPEALTAEGTQATRLTTADGAALQQALDRSARVANGNRALLADSLAAAVRQIPWVARAWTDRDLTETAPADSFAVLERHSFYPGRPQGLLSRLGVEMQLQPHVLTWGYQHGTGHGSPYYYDRHVPFIVMGPGVVSGKDPARVSTTDVAPTLALILGIPAPADLDGVGRPVR